MDYCRGAALKPKRVSIRSYIINVILIVDPPDEIISQGE